MSIPVLTEAVIAGGGNRSSRSFLQVLISQPAHDGFGKRFRIVGNKNGPRTTATPDRRC
jgi:hypothetical protein